jgi:hypothetical protein
LIDLVLERKGTIPSWKGRLRRRSKGLTPALLTSKFTGYKYLVVLFRDSCCEQYSRRHNVTKPSYDEINALAKELLDWQHNVKTADEKLRVSAKKTSISVKSSAPIRIVNAVTTAPDESSFVENEDESSSSQEFMTDGSLFSEEDSSSSPGTPPELADDANDAQESAPLPQAQKAKKHVRFADEVEAAAKANERRIQAQLKREQKIAREREAALAAQAKKNKKRHRKKSNTSDPKSEQVDLRNTETITDNVTTTSANEESFLQDAGSPTTTTTSITTTPIMNDSAKYASRIKSTDYRSWDRLNVDDALKAIDEEENQMSNSKSTATSPKTSKTRITPFKPDGSWVPPIENPAKIAANEHEFEYLAEMEKNKGNEAFKAGDFQDAVSFRENVLAYHSY